jgi:RNA polymerase sigma-70 factor (ECF subfamily)
MLLALTNPLTATIVEPGEDAAVCDGIFAELVQRQTRFVFRVAYAVLRNVHDADDVVQETFLKLYRTGQWKKIENEKAFLARAAWRIAVDRRPRMRMEPPDSGIPSHENNPEQAVIAADRNAIVHQLIDALPDELRQTLALSTVEELKSHEIATILGIPEGTVRSRLSRARQILKEKLGALMAGRYGK